MFFNNFNSESDVVAKLREELLSKERKLTDIRLEALTSQHQLHQMQDAMQRMRVSGVTSLWSLRNVQYDVIMLLQTEMETLRSENERLSRMGSSTMSLDSICQDTRRSYGNLAGGF